MAAVEVSAPPSHFFPLDAISATFFGWMQFSNWQFDQTGISKALHWWRRLESPLLFFCSMAQTKTNTYNVLPGTDNIWFLWSKQLYSGERKRCRSCAVTECKDRENSRQFCNFSFDTFPINVWQTKSMVDCWLGGYKLGLLSPLLPSPSLHLWNLINQGIHSEPTCVFYCVINPVLYCTVYS